MYSSHLSPYPTGWYAIGFTDELPAGTVLTRQIAGREVVLFRTQSGEAAALDPYCTHLGAHLGHGGEVVGDTIRCPFHGFCFDTQGVCTKTGYDTKPPAKARIQRWRLQEKNGILFLFFSADGAEPTFEIPLADDAAWTPVRHRELRLRGHVQEIAENSVDIGHLTWIHKYEDVRTLSELKTEGAYLNARYGMTRPRKTFGKSAGIATEFEIHQYGLGYARVEVTVTSLGIHTRQFVLASPLNENEIMLRLAMSVKRIEKPSTVHPLLALAPKGWVTNLVADQGIKEFEADVRQDLPIWQNKIYVTPPALAAGDGPVGAYRKWAKQFYAVPQVPLSSPAGEPEEPALG